MYPALVAMPVAVFVRARVHARASVSHFEIHEECETRTEVECIVCVFPPRQTCGPTSPEPEQIGRYVGNGHVRFSTFTRRVSPFDSRLVSRDFDAPENLREDFAEVPASIRRFNLHLVDSNGNWASVAELFARCF